MAFDYKKEYKELNMPRKSARSFMGLVLMIASAVQILMMVFTLIIVGAYDSTSVRIVAAMSCLFVPFFVLGYWLRHPKKKKDSESKPVYDPSYVKEMKQTDLGKWQQYDILLDTEGYGWETIKDWADYVAEKDLWNIYQVTVSHLGQSEVDLTPIFHENHDRCTNLNELNTEYATLALAGHSRQIDTIVKVIWYNQTNRLRIFTTDKDPEHTREYAECMVRRTLYTNISTMRPMTLGDMK